MTDPLDGVLEVPEDLWHCGHEFLPKIGAELAKAGGHASGADVPATAFSRPETHAGGIRAGVGPVAAAWVSAQEAMQGAIYASAVNLQATGRALKVTAEAYANQDGANADRFYRSVGDADPVESNLPPKPDEPFEETRPPK